MLFIHNFAWTFFNLLSEEICTGRQLSESYESAFIPPTVPTLCNVIHLIVMFEAFQSQPNKGARLKVKGT